MEIGNTAVGAVIAVITCVILISVYTSTNTAVSASVTTNTSADWAINNMSSNVYSGFQSLSILPTIVFAALLLGALGLLYVVFRQ